jgi:hypothetical protein
MAIKTTTGRAAFARAILLQQGTMFLAWGTGDADWDDDIEAYPVADNMTGLVAEIGRRKLTFGCFATPDDTGELITPAGNFTESPTPTPYLFTRFSFDMVDAPSATIREVGLYLFCTVTAGLPAGQKYFTPQQLDDPGMLVAVERFVGFSRTPDAVQSFGFVIPL